MAIPAVAGLLVLFVPCGGLTWLRVSFLLHIKDIISYRIVSYSFLSGYRYLGEGAADRREILHDGRAASWTCLFPFGGDSFRSLQIEGQKGLRVDHFWPFIH